MSDAAEPFVGAIVLYRPLGRHDQIEQAAIVTRVWPDGTLNVTVFPDFGEPVVNARCVYAPDFNDTPQSGAWRWRADVEKDEAKKPIPVPGDQAPIGLRADGPTFEEYTASGYEASNYPPKGYAERLSPGLSKYRAEQEQAARALAGEPTTA